MKRSPSSSRLSRWFGDDQLDAYSSAMRGWYGPPIPLVGSPSRAPVLAHADGDFSGGALLAGGVSSLMEHADGLMRVATARSSSTMGVGFSSLLDILLRLAMGRRQTMAFAKSAQSHVVGGSIDWFISGSMPAAGVTGGAAPGGAACTSATAGAMPLVNAKAGEQTYLLGGAYGSSSTTPGVVLLYDRLFNVRKTMSDVNVEAVTGVPTRYQSTTPGAADSAEGNFLFVDVFTTLTGAHNWTVCTYTDEAGNPNTIPSFVSGGSTVATRLDHAVGQWFAPLAAGSTGIKALTQMQCDAVVTGAADFVIAHPIGWMPAWTMAATRFDFRHRPFQMTRIFDDACLGMLELTKPAANNAIVNGVIETLSG